MIEKSRTLATKLQSHDLKTILNFLDDAYKEIDRTWQELNANKNIKNRFPRKKFDRAVAHREEVLNHLHNFPFCQLLHHRSHLIHDLYAYFQKGLLTESELIEFFKKINFLFDDMKVPRIRSNFC